MHDESVPPVKAVAFLMVLAFFATGALAQAPVLPEGLGGAKKQAQGRSDPALPSGLGDETGGQGVQPALPKGLDGREKREVKNKGEREKNWLPAGIDGFWEMRGGVRVKDDPTQDRVSLAEARLQLGYDKGLAPYIPRGRFRVTSDFVYDAVIDDPERIDLEEGDGFIDLRELWISLTPIDSMDIKAGRQILTWGTGNLIFLNDLFPKDYQSFFLGRDLEYLKAPSDAVKASFYTDVANLDMVYTPRFDADRSVDGTRLSFFDPALDRVRDEDMPVTTDRPDTWFEDDEIALRVYRNVQTYELAAYFYDGFWKGPAGSDPESGRRTFPPLSVYGASIRGPVGAGIGNVEFAWYRSKDDEDGKDPLVNNSELRFLVGYEQEIATDLTLGLQYYLEKMLDYDEYQANLPQGFSARDEARQWLTVDLTQALLAQNQLTLSLFSFYSLSGEDLYLRPKITYDYTDNWRFQVGANIFLGHQNTFFGQFEENSNVYAAVRRSF